MFTDLYLKFPDYKTAQQHLPVLQSLTEDIAEVGEIKILQNSLELMQNPDALPVINTIDGYHVNARLRGAPPWPETLAPFVLTPQNPKVTWYDGNSE